MSVTRRYLEEQVMSTHMSEEQRTALEACERLGIYFRQNGDYGHAIEVDLHADHEGWHYGHEDLVNVSPFVQALVVFKHHGEFRDGDNGSTVRFGLDCKWPVDHYHGSYSWREVHVCAGATKLYDALRLLADAYNFRFEMEEIK